MVFVLWGSILDPFPYFAPYYLLGHLIHTHGFNFVWIALILNLYLQPKPLFWALDPISSCHLDHLSTWMSPGPWPQCAQGWILHLPCTEVLFQGSSLCEWYHFQLIALGRIPGPPTYHPLNFPPYLTQHTKPSWFHLLADFQIHLFN